MNDNTTKIILHIDNNTGQVVRSEQEDAFGVLRETSGNFGDLVLTYGAPITQMNYRVQMDYHAGDALNSADNEVQSSELVQSVAPSV